MTPPSRRTMRALLDRDEDIVRRADTIGKGQLADAFFAGLRYAYEGGALPAFIAVDGDPLEAAILAHGLNDRGCAVFAVAERVGDAPDSIHARLATAGISVDPAELSKTIRAMHKAGRIDKTSMGYRLLKAGAS